MLRNLLLTVLPDGALPILFVFAGLALILGIGTRKAVFSFIGFLILLAVFTPFLDAIFNSLPWWVVVLFMAAFLIGLIKTVMHAVFGRAASAEFMGHLMYDVFLLPIRWIFGRRR